MTTTKDDRKDKLLELHSLVLDHLIELLRSGKTLKGTTLAIIVDFLKLHHVMPEGGAVTQDQAEAYLEELQNVELPFP